MLITIIGFILAIYLVTLVSGGRKLNIQTTKTVRVFSLVLSTVVIALLIMGQFNIYPRGYWVAKGLFWAAVYLMMILFAFGNRLVIYKIERIVYGLFFYLPLGFIPLLLIPVIGFGTALLFYVSFIGDKSFIIYSDKNIRIEKQDVRFMGPDPPLEVYLKTGLFCHKDTILPMGYNSKKDNIKVNRVNDSTYSLIHYSPDNWKVPNGFEEFRFQIKTK